VHVKDPTIGGDRKELNVGEVALSETLYIEQLKVLLLGKTRGSDNVIFEIHEFLVVIVQTHSFII